MLSNDRRGVPSAAARQTPVLQRQKHGCLCLAPRGTLRFTIRTQTRFQTNAFVLTLIGGVLLSHAIAYAEQPDEKVLRVKSTADFEVTGDGTAAAWKDVAWEPLSKRGKGGHPYDAQVKMLYSPKGVYVLFSGSDRKLTAALDHDFLDLWNEDVFEFFFWPDERQTVYFEYEISPLGFELPILVPNVDGKFLGWRPWHYEGDRLVRKATKVVGGEKKSGATIVGWSAEVFMPYKLLEPLGNVPPRPGTRWRANFYRVDYDDGQTTSWDWARVGPSFHEFRKFGTIVFE
jgi:hypothetical protein